jgi:phosphoenolpyruvate carboxykinase (GTP)
VIDAVAAALKVDPAEWTTETALIDRWYASSGERLPEALREELAALKSRLAEAQVGHPD